MASQIQYTSDENSNTVYSCGDFSFVDNGKNDISLNCKTYHDVASALLALYELANPESTSIELSETLNTIDNLTTTIEHHED